MYNKERLFALGVVLSTLLFTAIPFGFVQSSNSGIYATSDSSILGAILDDLFINELMAVNQITIPGPNQTYPDWIELFNAGNETVDLSGMYLTDDLTNPTSWRFPNGTSIDPAGYLLIWADNSSDPSSLHASFRLAANGEEVGLFASDGATLIDSIVYTGLVADVSYGRFPDGGSNWSDLPPTPGLANKLVADTLDGLFINEFMANNDAAVAGPDGTYPDWIELFNAGNETVDLSGMYLTDNLLNPDSWQFSDGSLIASGGYLVVWVDNSPAGRPLHASFGLNATGEAIGLFARDGESLVDSIVFGAQLDDVSYGRFPDGGSNWSDLEPTPGLANKLMVDTPDGPGHGNSVPDGLFINELMADNQITIPGPNQTYPDWIELFNAGNETVDLSGMYLTDDLTNPTSWRFPNGTSIDPAGYLLIWADNSSDPSSLHASFRLAANGEEVGLFASDGATLIDSIVYTKQIGDVSYGRLPDGSSYWTHLLRATPGWGNNKAQINSETSVWPILLLIVIIIALGLIIVIAGKINERRK